MRRFFQGISGSKSDREKPADWLKSPEEEAEFALLRYQTDPHVLFNNFNSLYAISIHKPELLGVSLGMLKDNLNYIFRDSRQRKTLLSREIEVIENFIGLERLRYGERLQVRFSQKGQSRHARISPLILYAFVETILLKGASENPFESEVVLELVCKNQMLNFKGQVSGEFLQMSSDERETCFISHRQRLEQTYRELYELNIKGDARSWGFELQIKI